MKTPINKFVFAIIALVALIGICWFGWRAMDTPENRGLDEEAIFRAAEKRAKSNGVDLRTIPQWAGVYYKYHPEEKPGAVAVQSIGPPRTDPSEIMGTPSAKRKKD